MSTGPSLEESLSRRRRKRWLLEGIGVVAATCTLFGFVTGWTTLRSMVESLWPGLNKEVHRAVRTIDLSEYLDSPSAREFLVPMGSDRGDFSYSADGTVFFRGASFRPSVQFRPDSVPEVLVSIPPSGEVAAVVGLDADGHRSFYLVHLRERRSVWCKAPAKDLYWSPDERYLVTLNAYEGQYFASVDTKTDAVRIGEFLSGPATLWHIEGKAKWSRDGKTLFAKAVEEVDPYSADDPEKAVRETPLDTFLIRVDVKSLDVVVSR